MSEENVEVFRRLWEEFEDDRLIRVTLYFTHADALKAAGLSD